MVPVRGRFEKDCEVGLKGYSRTDLMEIGQFQCVARVRKDYLRRLWADTIEGLELMLGMDTEYEYLG